MSTLRIKDAPLLPNVDGSEKIPTGGKGDFSVTLDQVKTFARGSLPQQLEDHINDLENPHNVTKDQVGLVNVDNTSDIDKPISTATQEALDLKANTADVDNALNLKADKTYVDTQDNLKLDKSEKGVSGGLATLDDSGKVPRTELPSFVDLDSNVPTYKTVADGVDPVIGVADGGYFNVRSEDNDTVAVEYQNVGGVTTPTGKSYPSSSYVENIAEYTALPFKQGKTYGLNERVQIDNGDIVKSIVANNTANPNVDMTGWVKTNNASQIFDENGNSQQQINNLTSEKTLNLLDFFTKSELSAYKADYTSVDILEAWQRATFAARYLNQKLSAFGKFRSASTLILNCAADLSSMVLESSATTIALDVRSDDFSYLSFAVLFLPEVTNLNKVTADNWVNTNATGIRLVNLNRCTVFVPRIDQFKVGLHEHATGVKGTAHNTIFIGQLFNNKINHLLGAGNDGSWVNQNKHEGGSYNHASDEGKNIADCHHIKIEACLFALNGNTFNQPSFENEACDFHVVNGGRYNIINQARWEVPAPSTPKVKYYCDDASASKANHGTLNEIHGGYEVTRIAFTFVGTGSAFCNATYSIDKSMINIQSNNGGHRYRNKFSANEPIFTFYDTSTQIENATKSQATVQFGSKYLYGKRETDTYNRFEIDFSNGAVKFLSGTEVTGAELFGNATNLMCSKTFAPSSTANNSDLGHASRKWRNVLLTGGVGFFNTTPPATQPSITGKKVPATIAEQNAVLDSIVAALVSYGIVIDGRTT